MFPFELRALRLHNVLKCSRASKDLIQKVVRQALPRPRERRLWTATRVNTTQARILSSRALLKALLQNRGTLLSDNPQRRTTSTSLQGGSESYVNSTSMEADEIGGTTPHKVHHHRAFFKRPSKGEGAYDKFLNPYDGRLCDLVVQSSTAVLTSTSRTPWRHINIGNGSSWMIRISNWAMSRDPGSEKKDQTDVWKAI